jgi:hypothetical protein
LHDLAPQILRIGSRHDGTFGIAYRLIRLVSWFYVPFAVMKSALKYLCVKSAPFKIASFNAEIPP